MSATEVVKVEARILHANGLKVADRYSSDPYVVLNFASKRVGKSKTKKKTLDPIWDETFSFKWKKSEDLTLNVFDSDHLSRDDFLGVVTVRYSDARMSAGRPRTYKLFPRSKKDKNISGSITVLFSFGSYADDPMFRKIEKVSQQKSDPCKVRILSANNLKESDQFSKIDPYAVMKCGHAQKKTHIADGGKNPLWEFESEIEWHKDFPFIIEIRDFDLLSSYDFLGFCRISNEKARSFGGKKTTLGLEGRSGNDEGITGEVVVQFLFEGMKDEPMQMSAACFDGIFGMSLEKIAELTGELIPNIVSDTINFLIHSGLARCGIFRLCGDVGEVQQLKKKYGTPLTSIELKKEGEFSPDSVASLLKRFFFELPNPLIDFGSFDKMLDAHGEFVDDEDEEKFEKKLIEIVVKMQKIHLYPFILMNHFLNRVASFSETNMMPLSNLAVCFGPTLSRTEEIRQNIMLEQLDRKIVERLLVIYPRLTEALNPEDKAYLENFKQKMDL